MAVPTNNRASFFDDDDLNIKFDWERLEKSPFKDILNHEPILRDTLSRTEANSQTVSVTTCFFLYQRCIVQFKVYLSFYDKEVLTL